MTEEIQMDKQFEKLLHLSNKQRNINQNKISFKLVKDILNDYIYSWAQYRKLCTLTQC